MTILPRHPREACEPPSRPPRRASATGRHPRVALYGHDTLGLGHVRRNLALAGAIASLPSRPDVLVLSGLAEAGLFRRPSGVDLVTLPAIRKGGAGDYFPAHLSADLHGLVRLRSDVLTSALTAWSPDLLVVDKMPLGFSGELEHALRALRREGSARVVLGLRDVLDAPDVATAEWRGQRCTEAIRAFYDEVWVYGDPQVGDLAADCAFPPGVRAKAHHVGLLSAGRPGAPRRPTAVGGRPYVLCLVGGGQDGGRLAQQFAAAPMPAGHAGVLVTGPFLPAAELDAVRLLARGRSDLTVIPFCEDSSTWVPAAAAVVAMGGYNTVTEILATATPALLVPRVAPRREQLIRAQRLGALGMVDVALPDDGDAARIGSWLSSAVTGPRIDRSRLARDGLQAVAHRAAALIPRRRAGAVPSSSAQVHHAAS